MGAWDLLVDKADLSQTKVRAAPAPAGVALSDGETLLEIERFSLTANNVTYAVFGDRLGYWRFFPAPDGWGRIPVWGFARVVASLADGVEPGLRLYGYWPMSTHHVARLRASGSGFVDETEHRVTLPAAYNRYDRASATGCDDKLALLRPLFITSFLLDDYLGEIAPHATPVLSSASSRTAIGLAWLLARRGRPAIALTSARNAAFVRSLSIYAQVLPYDAVEALELDGPVAFVDMAGNAAVRADVHRRFGDGLAQSVIVGSTHHDAAPADSAPMPGAKPTFFFAPDRLVKRRADWGAGQLAERTGVALDAFIDASGWLVVERHEGPDALVAAYQAVLAGEARPDLGHVILPGPVD